MLLLCFMFIFIVVRTVSTPRIYFNTLVWLVPFLLVLFHEFKNNIPREFGLQPRSEAQYRKDLKEDLGIPHSMGHRVHTSCSHPRHKVLLFLYTWRISFFIRSHDWASFLEVTHRLQCITLLLSFNVGQWFQYIQQTGRLCWCEIRHDQWNNASTKHIPNSFMHDIECTSKLWTETKEAFTRQPQRTQESAGSSAL